MNWLAIRHRVEFFVFQVFACFLLVATPRCCARCAQQLAFVVCHILPRRLTRHAIARANLRVAFGTQFTDQQIDEIIYRMWVHLFRMIAELVQLPRKIRLTNVHDVVSFHNDRSGIVTALCSDRPVILLSGHFGNWEISVTTFGVFGFSVHFVARPLDNPYLNDWFLNSRSFTGNRMIPKKGGFKHMAAVLEQGGTIALLADQDAGARGTFVDFFGKPASTFSSIARLAVEYNAYICVGYARRIDDDFINHRWVRYEFGNAKVIDPLDFHGDDRDHQITQQFTAALEQAIRRSPEQYFWLHRRWKTTPEQADVLRREKRKAG